jgi:hypothetical protein
MKQLILSLLLFAGHMAALRSEPFEEAEVKKAINLVSLLFLISNAGRVKVICLSHKVLVYFTANPKIRVALLPGQMLNIPAGEKKMPPVARISLKTLLATSMLGEAGDFGPLPSQTILANNASKQGTAFVPANASASVNDPAFSNGATPANVNSTTQALKPCVPPRSPIIILARSRPQQLQPRPEVVPPPPPAWSCRLTQPAMGVAAQRQVTPPPLPLPRRLIRPAAGPA